MDNVFNKLKKYNSDKYNPKLFKYDDVISLKFNLSKNLNIKCFRNDDFDIIKFDKDKVYFEKEIILNNIKKCKILPLYILSINHLVSIIVDSNKKKISLFTNTNNKKLKSFCTKIIESLNLNYKIVIDDKKMKCDSYYNLCVPLSLLMVYSYFNNVDMENYIKYINEISIESAYNLIDNFINYLEN